jgi:hypothetical protein
MPDPDDLPGEDPRAWASPTRPARGDVPKSGLALFRDKLIASLTKTLEEAEANPDIRMRAEVLAHCARAFSDLDIAATARMRVRIEELRLQRS